MAEIPSNSAVAAGEPDAAKKLRAAVEQLLAMAPVCSEGAVQPAGHAQAMRYAARVEFLPVVAEGFDAARGEPDAAVMATSYCLQGDAPPDRPVCFAFNGGPGSASIWLHLGALGPRRVVVPDDGSAPRAPYRVVDNPLTWFEHFDLVFIDPPHTGWSITASEAARKRMLSVDGDVDALAEVMRAWLTRHRRWSAPLVLAGESYGTTRAAALADKLQVAGLPLAGLVLVSCAMDLQTIAFGPGNELPYALFVPGFAGVAQYHGLLDGAVAASPEAARSAAEAFVAEDYVAALHRGSLLEGRQRTRIARRLAELTGLSRDLVEQRNLRISDHTYFVEALRPRGQILGRLDARVSAPMAASGGPDWDFDPGIESIAGPYTMAAMDYFGRTLGVPIERRYEVLNRDAHKAWNWNRGDAQGNGYACTTPDLARALRRHPHLKVFVASGHYDLGTPYSATDWSLSHLDVPAEVLRRVTRHRYDAGHMMYTRGDDLLKLKNDLTRWLG